jgi:hypothetical protein
MQDDVGVAVADQSAVMGDFDAAQPERAAGAEGMDVEAEAGAGGQARGQKGLGAREVLVIGQLLQPRIAGHGGNAEAGGAGDLGIVGRVGALPGRVGADDVGVAEGLRGLNPDEPVAGHGVTQTDVIAGQGIDDWQHRHRPLMGLEGVEQAIDDRRRKEGAGGIVDQHLSDPAGASECRQAVSHRLLARRASGDGRGEGEGASRVLVERLLALADHHPDFVDAGVLKRGKGMREEGPPTQPAILLRQLAPGAAAASRRDDQGHRLSPRFHGGGSYPTPTLPASAFDPISAVS